MLALSFVDVTKDSVVWTYEEAVTGSDNNRPARRTHARINDRNMDCSFRKRWIGRDQCEGGGLDVLRRYVVSDVDDYSGWVERKDYTSQRGGKVISSSEVGE